jgi:hypothetical protein
MTSGQMLNRIRELYLDAFKAAVAERRRNASVLTEVALRDANGRPVTEGALSLPLRVDIGVLTGPDAGLTVSVDSKSRASFRPLSFLSHKRLEVTLQPFFWDSLRVSTIVTDWKPVQQWFMQWFSPDLDGAGDPIGVVHFMSDPKTTSTGESFELDLGTAPVAAFEELLDALKAAGASKVVLDHP